MEAPSPVLAPPSRPDRATAVTRRSRRSVRVVVLEAPADLPDFLDADCEVVLRLPADERPERLGAVLAWHRPKLLLVKGPLDCVDERVITMCLATGVRIAVLARPVYGLLQPGRLVRLGGLPWIRLRDGRPGPGAALARRLIDVTLTLLSAPLSVPLMVVITTLVARSGPALYVQYRVGIDGRLFRMFKFRTMCVDAEAGTGPAMTTTGDERVTRIGAVLRRLRLDELPQLWNVLRGDMSLVGPRPERPEFITDYLRLPHYGLRNRVSPGLTGIAQLTGGYTATVEEKLRCDLLYLNCRSIWLDLKLLALTVIEFLRGFPRG